MKSERERTAGGFVGHTEDGEAVGTADMEDVAVLRVGDVGVVVSGNLLEDLPGDGACVRRRRRELRQHHRSPCHQREQNRHLRQLRLDRRFDRRFQQILLSPSSISEFL